MKRLISVLAALVLLQTKIHADNSHLIAYIKDGLGDLKHNDKRMALELWADDIAKSENTDMTVASIEGVGELLGLIDQHKVVTALMNTSTLMNNFEKLRPVISDRIIAIKRHPGLYEDFVIITKKSSGIQSFEQLRGKTISSVEDFMTLNTYLTYITQTQSGLSAQKYFSKISFAKTSAKSVLDVYFDKSDAAILSRHIYETSLEMNPALSHQLNIIHNSGAKFITVVFILFNNIDTEYGDQFVRSLLKHQNTVRGHEFLQLFQIDGFQDVSIKDLEAGFFIYGY